MRSMIKQHIPRKAKKRSKYLLVLTVFLSACGTGMSNKIKEKHSNERMNSQENSSKKQKDFSEDLPYEDFYIVIADTGQDYVSLQKRMVELHEKSKIPIDTLGRTFNSVKKRIALPDDAADELYAGDYFPRRFPSESLSLEYLSIYQNHAGSNTIALVTGIFNSTKEANRALQEWKKKEVKAFKIKSSMYVGCMH